MATHRVSILGAMTKPDATGTVFQVPISTQLSLTNTDIGNVLCFVMQDHSADNGIYGAFKVPKNYVGTGKIVVSGILDGAPGASDVLGFTIKGSSLADNEAADAAFGTEDTASATIGSSGSGYSDEDYLEMSITLSNVVPVVDDTIYFFLARDDGTTTYTGNFLLTEAEFEYSDA